MYDAMAGDCCAPATISDKLADLADDPALADCCRRDLLEQAFVERVRAQLSAVDPTVRRTELSRAAVASTPAWSDTDGSDEGVRQALWRL